MKKIVFMMLFAFLSAALFSFAEDGSKTNSDIKSERITDKRLVQLPINKASEKQGNRSSALSAAQKITQGLKNSSENAMSNAGAITGLRLSGGNVGDGINNEDDDNMGM